MKKIIFTALLGMIYVGSASAAPNNVGCGWGSMIFDGKTGVASEVMAATTNGTLGNQTFGITSGTAGCAKDGVVQRNAAADAFMGANIEKVARDMSVGQGEALATLADTLGIKSEDKAHFYAVTKTHFDVIFPSENVTSQEVLSSLQQVMAADSKLAQYTAA